MRNKQMDKIRYKDEIDLIKSAIHARKFSNLETFEEGLNLIGFALRFKEKVKKCEI